MDEVTEAPWTRKHDDPRRPLFASVPRIVYPQSLDELRALCQNPDRTERFTAAGSHWSLSTGAISDHTFIETHDPSERHPALGRTLHTVLPNGLSERLLNTLGEDRTGERGSLVHIESGKRIYQAYSELEIPDALDNPTTLAGYLNATYDNPTYAGPWAFHTLGGAGGQTVVGAFSTGTHGGDFTLPPLADGVQAIHLVADGGAHYWFEPEHSDWGPPLTEDDKLTALYPDIRIRRSDKAFRAALVSAGRLGVIYSVVLHVIPQYALREHRVLSRWETVKDQIKDPDSSLYHGDESDCRFLQIAVCLTPFLVDSNLVGVTRRWNRPPAGQPGRVERVGELLDLGRIDPLIQAPRFSVAGRCHEYVPDQEHPERAGDPDPLVRACVAGSFLVNLLDVVVQEIDNFVTSSGTVIGAGIAAVAVPGAGAVGAGLLALFEPLALIVLALRELLEALDPDTRLGEVFDKIRGVLLFPGLDPINSAGVFVWRLIGYYAFSSEQGEQDYVALSYAVMDKHDYLSVNCDVNVDSIEVFFDAAGDEVVAFVDALLNYEAAQEHAGRAFVGYASLRFTGKSSALLGPQRWQRSCAVEVSCLRDVSGSQELFDYTVQLALSPNFGGVLHWGQRNDSSALDIAHAFGNARLADPFTSDLEEWREVLADVTDNGRRQGFSNAFSRQTGLEVL